MTFAKLSAAWRLASTFSTNGFNAVSFFLGSVGALWLSKAKPKIHEQYTVPVSSGIIAGESLMGVAIAFLTIFHVLQ